MLAAYRALPRALTVFATGLGSPIGDDGSMSTQGPGPSELSEISSIASSLEQISRRVTALAETALAAKRDDVGADLIAVERSLLAAVRRLERLLAAKR
jgi:hypothetical protein